MKNNLLNWLRPTKQLYKYETSPQGEVSRNPHNVYTVKMTTINIRIDEKVKKEAMKTLSHFGLDMSTAVKLFLNQVVIEKGLPFTPSSIRKAIRKKWDEEVEEALKGKGYKTAKEALDAALE
jgi:addiction module RelB/DinJ family antitoxin